MFLNCDHSDQFISREEFNQYREEYLQNPDQFKYKGISCTLVCYLPRHKVRWLVRIGLSSTEVFTTWMHENKEDARASALKIIDLGDKEFLDKQVASVEKEEEIALAWENIRLKTSKNVDALQKLISTLIINSTDGKILIDEKTFAKGLELTPRILLNRSKYLLELGLIKEIIRHKNKVPTSIILTSDVRNLVESNSAITSEQSK